MQFIRVETLEKAQNNHLSTETQAGLVLVVQADREL